jgi:ATP-dependent DNA ligase
LSYTRLLFRYHPDAPEAYNTHSSLQAVCADPRLRNPAERSSSTIRPGQGFGVMRCEALKVDIGEVQHASVIPCEWTGSDFFIESKLDGERITVHVMGGGAQLFVFMRSRARDSEYERALGPAILSALGLRPPTADAVAAAGLGGGDGQGHLVTGGSVKGEGGGVWSDIEEVILDGELVVFDTAERTWAPFGRNTGVAKSMLNTSPQLLAALPMHLVFVAFDVLHLKRRGGTGAGAANGGVPLVVSALTGGRAGAPALGTRECLLSVPLSQRKEILRFVIPKERENPFVQVLSYVRAGGSHAAKQQLLANHFDAAMRRFEEGIVIKKTESSYALGKSHEWRKVKPNGTLEHLDAVIVGGYKGNGNRSHLTASYLLACAIADPNGEDALPATVSQRDGGGASQGAGVPAPLGQSQPVSQSRDGPSVSVSSAASPKSGRWKWKLFCKVGGGMSLADLAELDKLLEPNRVYVTKQTIVRHSQVRWPEGVLPPSTLAREDIPDFLVRDMSRSMVIEIKAAELLRDEKYANTLSFNARFPRAVRIRRDKRPSPLEVVSDQQLEGFWATNNGKLHLTGASAQPRQARQKQTRASGSAAAQAGALIAGFGFSAVAGAGEDARATALAGKVVCVLQGEYDCALAYRPRCGLEEKKTGREVLIGLVRQLGGSAVDTVSPSRTDYVIGERAKMQSRNVVLSCAKDVLSAQWLMDIHANFTEGRAVEMDLDNDADELLVQWMLRHPEVCAQLVPADAGDEDTGKLPGNGCVRSRITTWDRCGQTRCECRQYFHGMLARPGVLASDRLSLPDVIPPAVHSNGCVTIPHGIPAKGAAALSGQRRARDAACDSDSDVNTASMPPKRRPQRSNPTVLPVPALLSTARRSLPQRLPGMPPWRPEHFSAITPQSAAILQLLVADCFGDHYTEECLPAVFRSLCASTDVQLCAAERLRKQVASCFDTAKSTCLPASSPRLNAELTEEIASVSAFFWTEGTEDAYGENSDTPLHLLVRDSRAIFSQDLTINGEVHRWPWCGGFVVPALLQGAPSEEPKMYSAHRVRAGTCIAERQIATARACFEAYGGLISPASSSHLEKNAGWPCVLSFSVPPTVSERPAAAAAADASVVTAEAVYITDDDEDTEIQVISRKQQQKQRTDRQLSAMQSTVRISIAWIHACIEARKLVDAGPFCLV